MVRTRTFRTPGRYRSADRSRNPDGLVHATDPTRSVLARQPAAEAQDDDRHRHAAGAFHADQPGDAGLAAAAGTQSQLVDAYLPRAVAAGRAGAHVADHADRCARLHA